MQIKKLLLAVIAVVGFAASAHAVSLSGSGTLTKDQCRIYVSTGQSVTRTTWTKLNASSVTYDTNGLSDAANSRVIIKNAGKYLVIAQVAVQSWANGNNAYPGIYLNGSILNTRKWTNSDGVGTDNKPVFTLGTFSFSANDILELYVYTDATGTPFILPDTAPDGTFLSVTQL